MAALARAAGLALCLMAAPALALEWGPYLARYVKNYDGDTITFDILIYPDLQKRDQVRLRGVDTPEIRGQCDRERRKAIEARDFVRAAVAEAPAHVVIHGFGKYGRPLVDVQVAGGDLGAMLLAAGLAREYTGGPRLGWCGQPS